MAISLSTDDKLEYHFYPVASGQLQFRIKAPHDAHIALTTGPQEEEPMYEVFIGGWNNSKSVIRKNRAKPDVAEVQTPDILSGDEYRGFWIRWDDGAISVGKEGEPSSFLTYADPEPFAVGYFGVCTGWGASGEWLIEGYGAMKTRDELTYKFHNIRSGSVLIEVRAKSNAHIALTNKKGESSPMYEIMLGGWENTASVIRYDRKQPDKVRVNTPNLLNENETKKFAICWLDGRIMVKAGNVNGSVIMEWQDPKPIGVSYVGVRTGWGSAGKWKLQTAQYPSRLAPNSKNTNPSAPPPQPAEYVEMGKVCWVDSSDGLLPPSAVEGGKDDETLYVGRAYHEGALLPGKVKPGHSACYVAWGGGEHRKSEYQVLCGCEPAWVPTSGNNIPPNAIPGGETEDNETLYVGRVEHSGTLTIGKVQPSHSVCYIPYGGAEVAYPEYEIMVEK
ncbi:C3 and PZP-like alpha-2-macroglobulin domain-containing protein 8 [Anthophora retusa]